MHIHIDYIIYGIFNKYHIYYINQLSNKESIHSLMFVMTQNEELGR